MGEWHNQFRCYQCGTMMVGMPQNHHWGRTGFCSEDCRRRYNASRTETDQRCPGGDTILCHLGGNCRCYYQR